MATVRALLDNLVAGRAILADVARDFSERVWLPMPTVDDAERWGVTDPVVPAGDSWAVVQNDPRLTPEQYQVLGNAYRKAVGR